MNCRVKSNQQEQKPTTSRKRPSAPSTSSSAKKPKHQETPSRQQIDIDPLTPSNSTLPDDEDLHNIFIENWSAIRTRFYKTKRVQDVFNYRLSSISTQDLEQQLIDDVFSSQMYSFKIDIAYGFILREVTSGALRYFHSSQNNGGVLMEPQLVKDLTSFKDFLSTIENTDILEWARQRRPNSKWVVELVTNATFFINKILVSYFKTKSRSRSKTFFE